ncbi:MAG: FAD-dependent oxidoreductase [Ilumatobacter sp.]|nr:MAG: FAD-dependent oxidoreductase [Ilumatobacter sp.]
MSRAHERPVVVVGAGLAGLACATALHREGVPVRVMEASDGVGGRVRTDHVDGFTLDRGFQVMLTAYPELHRQFDVAALDLREFAPGALVWRNGRGSAVVDPFRDPRHAVATALAPIGSPFDKLRIARLRHSLRSVHPALLLAGDDRSTAATLADRGFSDTMIERFFRPLVGGIQLDPELQASRRMFDIVFRMLADGAAAVPAAGMAAVPEQLAAHLPDGTIELGAPVSAVRTGMDGAAIEVDGQHHVSARAVVVATDGPVAGELLGIAPVGSKSVGCVYFAAHAAPTDTKMVVLDGARSGPVLNVAVMSNVAPEYAPAGSHLVVAAMPGETGEQLESSARRQLRGWWGAQVDQWQHLRTYRIPHGQPSQDPPFRPKQRVSLGHGLFVCGDHRDTASIQGALYSGRRCADAVLAHLDVARDVADPPTAHRPDGEPAS